MYLDVYLEQSRSRIRQDNLVPGSGDSHSVTIGEGSNCCLIYNATTLPFGGVVVLFPRVVVVIRPGDASRETPRARVTTRLRFRTCSAAPVLDRLQAGTGEASDGRRLRWASWTAASKEKSSRRPRGRLELFDWPFRLSKSGGQPWLSRPAASTLQHVPRCPARERSLRPSARAAGVQPAAVLSPEKSVAAEVFCAANLEIG